MRTHTFEFRDHLDFADVLGGKCVVAVGIGPEREAILLTVDPESQTIPFERDKQSGTSFPRSVVEHPYPATVFRLKNSRVSRVDLPEVDAAFPHIQPLADDHTLIVSARCHYRNGNPEQNAVIYDQHGQVIRCMVFGDGIQDVQVACDQRIWVSYFDEGVFGNFGWPYPPMGADGLLCFDTDGQIVWQFHAPGGFDSMADCYALNVANDAVWICYYTNFPVVQITSDGTVQGWENEFAGVAVLVIDRQRILLWGGYDKERNRCIVQAISGGKLVSPQRLKLCLPDGEPLDKARLIGRGSIIHAFAGTRWYQFDLRNLPTSFA
ncbi:MAG TPA: hypothetical protein VHS06_02320 [Chloroflexota bacterium]|nr:hypothetical protein [Chloroflexota bacterium]